jgi:hypothetical protein
VRSLKRLARSLCFMICIRKALGAESCQTAVLDGESGHGVKPGSVAFPACNCGARAASSSDKCCLTRTLFRLAVSFPGTPRALVAAANDTTPALAVKRPQFDSTCRYTHLAPSLLHDTDVTPAPIEGPPNVATLVSTQYHPHVTKPFLAITLTSHCHL